MTVSDFTDLHSLARTDLVRYRQEDDKLILLLVGDNEEEEAHTRTLKIDAELADEGFEADDNGDADEGLNGHLFEMTFHDVTNLKIVGEEADNYHCKSLTLKDHHIELIYDAINFTGADSEVSFSFDFASFSVRDMGKIDGPDV